ncbi:MAG: sugar O-acetyltransferase [Clostridia bacterium]|nr:sugar O-acetyltransferase [Clostridia bacterium]
MLDNRNGTLYNPVEPWRKQRKKTAHDLNRRFNSLDEEQTEQRQQVLQALLGEVNEGVFFNGPITFHYGVHTHIGAHTFINFNFTCQDDTDVFIGEHCDFGPNVTIVTPCHPMLRSEREALLCPDGTARRLCYAKPVHIGNGCWLCANVVVCPGVTIGEGCVIGAGSVVTRDIPPHSFAAGNPCRVIRTLTEADSLRCHPEILGDCAVIDGNNKKN